MIKIEQVKLISRDDNVTAVAWSPDGRYLALLENFNSLVTIWNTRIWRLLHSISRPKYGGFPLVFTPDSRLLIVSSTRLGLDRSALSVIDVASGKTVRQVKGPNPIDGPNGWPVANIPNDIAISEDGRYVFVNHQIGGVYTYETERWSIIAHLPQRPMAMVAGPGPDQFITSDSFGTLQVWRMPEGVLIREIPTGFCSRRKMVLDSKRCRLVTGQWEYKTRRDDATGEFVHYDGQDTIHVWDLNTGDKLRSVTMPDSITSVDYAADMVAAIVHLPYPLGRDAIADSQRHNLLYCADDMRQIASLRMFSDMTVGAANFRSDGEQLAIAGEAQVVICSIKTPRKAKTRTFTSPSPTS